MSVCGWVGGGGGHGDGRGDAGAGGGTPIEEAALLPCPPWPQYLLMRIENLNEQLTAELARQEAAGQAGCSSSGSGGGGGGDSGSSAGCRGAGGGDDPGRAAGSRGSSLQALRATAPACPVGLQAGQAPPPGLSEQGPHSSAALTALDFLEQLEPCTHGLDSMFCFLPQTQRFGIAPVVEGRIRCRGGG